MFRWTSVRQRRIFRPGPSRQQHRGAGARGCLGDVPGCRTAGRAAFRITRRPGPLHHPRLLASSSDGATPNELVADPTRGPRAELVLTLRGGTGIASGVARTLAVLAAAPSVEGVVLLEDALLGPGRAALEGHRVHGGAFSVTAGSKT